MTSQKGQLTFLGTGGSSGIPLIACPCAVCHSPSPFNNRLRSAALCTIDGKHLLIDCGPDFRQQALKFNIDHLDGVLLTHAHYDHTAGIDELRAFHMFKGEPLPCLLSVETQREIGERFPYLFGKGSYKFGTRLKLHCLESTRGQVNFLGINIGYFSYEQMGMRVDGFRFGDMAYISDIRIYPKTIFEDLTGVKTLILSALRFSESPMHFTVDEAVAFAKRVGAQKTWLMHIAHELDHDQANAYLPENIRMAYDGLQIDFDF